MRIVPVNSLYGTSKPMRRILQNLRLCNAFHYATVYVHHEQQRNGVALLQALQHRVLSVLANARLFPLPPYLHIQDIATHLTAFDG